MVTAAAGKPGNDAAKSTAELEAEIAELKADLEKLAQQFAKTSEAGYGAAKRAAALGADQLRSQGEAALEGLRANARDMEDQFIAQVREKPVTSLAIAAGVGFLFALLSRR
jgi:ElaB/YqjD/DUF883 family membrane-anchored ribosome-binding protein